MESIQRILSKLARVRWRWLKCFGSDRHRFRLNPPLDESAIQDFETKHHVRLPEDYRTFLREAGNGGAGPYYGLEPLEPGGAVDDELARPCLMRPEMPPPSECRQECDDYPDGFLDGCLRIVLQGCSCFAMLVVTGEHRGRVFYVDISSGLPPYFVHHPDFLSWYERWLDELLWGFDDSWFGLGLPGREGDMIAVIQSKPERMKADGSVTRFRRTIGLEAGAALARIRA